LILAVDTATDALGLALFDGRRIVAEESIPAPMRHTVELAPAVESLLRRCGATVQALKAVAVAQGPGSFTALRIGVAFAAGLSIPRNLPVIGVPTLDILAGAQPPAKQDLVAFIPAGRGRAAWRLYQCKKGEWRAEGETQASTWEELAARAPRNAILCGEADRDGRAILEKRRDLECCPPHLSVRRSAVLAERAAALLGESKERPGMPLPVYLHTIGTPAAES
jgi:tRNA threonylcarbamoyladenosine biosynthesis protein TsaB